MKGITWIERRGQIKHLLYELCLTGRIDKETFCEQLQDLNNVEPIVRCKDCKRNHTEECSMWYESDDHQEQYSWNNPDDYCSRGERREE